MNFELVLLLIICITTFLMFIIHSFTKKHDNKFSCFINKLWHEWFEEQHNAIIYGICFIGIIVIFILLISSCEKESYKNECVNVLETFKDHSDNYSDYYYDKCKSISDNEEEIEICIDKVKLTTDEIKDFCDLYIELNEDYDDYREY